MKIISNNAKERLDRLVDQYFDRSWLPDIATLAVYGIVNLAILTARDKRAIKAIKGHKYGKVLLKVVGIPARNKNAKGKGKIASMILIGLKGILAIPVLAILGFDLKHLLNEIRIDTVQLTDEEMIDILRLLRKADPTGKFKATVPVPLVWAPYSAILGSGKLLRHTTDKYYVDFFCDITAGNIPRFMDITYKSKEDALALARYAAMYSELDSDVTDDLVIDLILVTGVTSFGKVSRKLLGRIFAALGG